MTHLAVGEKAFDAVVEEDAALENLGYQPGTHRCSSDTWLPPADSI